MGIADAESAVDPAFPHQQQAEQVVAPDGLSPQIREQYARDIAKLTPLILEIKAGKATRWAISKRPGVSSVTNAFNQDATLKPASTSTHARSIRNKLQAILQSHPKVAEDFKAALDQPVTQESNLEQFASELRDLIPLILEVKEGCATPWTISKRPGMGTSFLNAFDASGNLKPGSLYASAQSIHKKLQAIGQAHPDVALAFEAATNMPQTNNSSRASTSSDPIRTLLSDCLMRASNEFAKAHSSMTDIARAAGVSEDALRPFFTESGPTEQGLALLGQWSTSIQPAVMRNFRIGHNNRAAERSVNPAPAQTRVNIAPRQGALPPRAAEAPSVGPSRGPATGQPRRLRQATSNIAGGTADGESAVESAFHKSSGGTGNVSAQSIHKKLQAIGQAHPDVALAFVAATNMPQTRNSSRASTSLDPMQTLLSDCLMRASTAFAKACSSTTDIARAAGVTEDALRPFFTESGLTEQGLTLLGRWSTSIQAAVMQNVWIGQNNREAPARTLLPEASPSVTLPGSQWTGWAFDPGTPGEVTGPARPPQTAASGNVFDDLESLNVGAQHGPGNFDFNAGYDYQDVTGPAMLSQPTASDSTFGGLESLASISGRPNRTFDLNTPGEEVMGPPRSSAELIASTPGDEVMRRAGSLLPEASLSATVPNSQWPGWAFDPGTPGEVTGPAMLPQPTASDSTFGGLEPLGSISGRHDRTFDLSTPGEEVMGPPRSSPQPAASGSTYGALSSLDVAPGHSDLHDDAHYSGDRSYRGAQDANTSHPGTHNPGAYSAAWIAEPAAQHEVHDLGSLVGNGWHHGNQYASRLMFNHLETRGLLPSVYGDSTSFLIHGKLYRAQWRTGELWLTQVQSPRELARASLPEQPFPFGLLASDLNDFLQRYNADMGFASGQGLNCLLDSMMQLRTGIRRGRDEAQQTQALDGQVRALRSNLEHVGLVPANDMIDFYGPGAVGQTIAAALGLRVQIIEQQDDGRLTAHDAIGAGQLVRVLHTPGHFQPLWPDH